MNPSRYELYLDLSGSTSRCSAGHEFVTVGGVSLLPEATDALRNEVARLPKWRDTSRETAERVAFLIRDHAVVALTLRVYKEPAAWTRFWHDASAHYGQSAQAGEGKRVRYLRPESAIQRELFGECSARLVGETVERAGRPTVCDAHGRSAIQLKVIVDH
jgi:hypothetical protein